MSDPEMPEMSSEENERMSAPHSLARGPQGEQGEQGDQGPEGTPGLPKATRRAIVFLFILNFALIVVGYLFLSNAVKQNNHQRCQSLAAIVAIPVPVPLTDNPSRQWVAKYSLIQRQRGAELGCELPPPRFVNSP